MLTRTICCAIVTGALALCAALRTRDTPHAPAVVVLLSQGVAQ